METEYKIKFEPRRLSPTVSHSHVTVGPKTESGFTEGKDLQPFTFLERKMFVVEPNKTPISVTKSDFMLAPFLQGAEARRRLRSLSSAETGFTRGAIAPLADPSSLLPSPQTETNAPTKKIIGKKEATGSLLNNPKNQVFPNTPYDCSHFTTHYKSMFCQQADYKKVKSGCTTAGISAKMDTGYSRSYTDRFMLCG